MTDTPSQGASADARVHGDPSALTGVTVTKLAQPKPISSAQADALFASQGAPAHDLDTVVVDASALKPQLTALARWAIHGVGIWLITYGLSQTQEAGLEPIATGLLMSGAALAWSLLQKRLAGHRLEIAAAADPAKVVLK